jgi:hypothetical protein
VPVSTLKSSPARCPALPLPCGGPIAIRNTSVGFVEHRDLTVETDRGAGYQRFPGGDARAVHRMARRKIVAAIENDIGRRNKAGELIGSHPRRNGLYPHFRIDRVQARFRGVDLGRPDIGG